MGDEVNNRSIFALIDDGNNNNNNNNNNNSDDGGTATPMSSKPPTEAGHSTPSTPRSDSSTGALGLPQPHAPSSPSHASESSVPSSSAVRRRAFPGISGTTSHSSTASLNVPSSAAAPVVAPPNSSSHNNNTTHNTKEQSVSGRTAESWECEPGASVSSRFGATFGPADPMLLDIHNSIDIVWRWFYVAFAVGETCALMSHMAQCEDHGAPTWMLGVWIIGTLMSLLHILYSFFSTTYFRHNPIPYGYVREEAPMVRATYLKTWFALDLILSLPIDLIVFGVDRELAYWMSLYRTSRLIRIPGLVLRGTVMSLARRRARIMCIFVCAILLGTHVIACIFVRSRSCRYDYADGLMYASSLMGVTRHTIPQEHLDDYTVLTMLIAVAALVWYAGFFLWVSFTSDLVTSSAAGAARLVKFMAQHGVGTVRQRAVVSQYFSVRYVLHNPTYLNVEFLSPYVVYSLLSCTKIAFLQRTKIFGSLGPEGLGALSRVMTHVAYPAKHMLADIGESARGMIILLDGVLEVENSAGEIIGLLQPGSWFGESCLLQPSVRIARVMAVTRVMVLSLLREDALLVGEQYSEVMALFPNNSNNTQTTTAASSDDRQQKASEGTASVNNSNNNNNNPLNPKSNSNNERNHNQQQQQRRRHTPKPQQQQQIVSNNSSSGFDDIGAPHS
eukprot:PhM_4_TR10540/c0_g1_i1/m.40124/K04910/KCNH7; potassium voltage-gated channel Eag-related subfamily H member 7